MMDNPEVKEKAEFNMAVSYLNRLNSLFYAADEAAIRLDIYSWFHVLVAIFREISTEMNDEDQEICNNEILDMNSMVMKEIANFHKTQKLMITPDVYMKMHKFELKMRNVMKESGLQMKTISAAENAFMEGN